MKKPFLIMMACLAFNATADDALKEENQITPLDVVTKAEFISVEPPEYPSRALRQRIEGWVVLRMVVKPDGTTGDIEIVDSSIEKVFDRAAIESAKTRLYKPAMSHGQPIMQGNVLVRSIFAFSDANGGVGRPFKRSYAKVQEAIEDNQLEKAKALIDKLDSVDKRLLAEVCYLDMLKASYFAKTGDKKATLRHVERALVLADDVATKPIYMNLLRQGIVDNALMSNFQKSLSHYRTLLEVDETLSADDPMHAYVRKIEAIVNGDKNIVSTAVVSRECQSCENKSSYWRNTLNRNQFTIDQVEGRLDSLDIICENSIVSVSYEAGMSWGVNRHAGDCGVKVIGEAGTSFRLIEMPNKS